MLNFRVHKIGTTLQLVLAALLIAWVRDIPLLGHPVQGQPLWIRVVAILAIQTAAFWLVEYFHLPLHLWQRMRRRVTAKHFEAACSIGRGPADGCGSGHRDPATGRLLPVMAES